MSYVVLKNLGEIIPVNERLLGAITRLNVHLGYRLHVPSNSHEKFQVTQIETTTVEIFLRSLDENDEEIEKLYDITTFQTDPSEAKPFLLEESDFFDSIPEANGERAKMRKRVDSCINYLRREEALNSVQQAQAAGARHMAISEGGEEPESEEDLQRVIRMPGTGPLEPRLQPFTESEINDQKIRIRKLTQLVESREVVQSDLKLSDVKDSDIIDATVDKLTQLTAILNSAN